MPDFRLSVRALALAWMIAPMLSVQALATDSIPLSRFTRSDGPVPAPWQLVRLNQKVTATRYQLVRQDGIIGIEAVANASMALLGRPLKADLSVTPVLCWRWRIDAPLVNADMSRKSGDDYAARVYVALAMPAEKISFVLRTQLKLARALYGDSVPDAAINYVWDNRQPVGTRRANAYTDRTQMVVVETGGSHARQWREVRRDLAADIEQAFPEQQARPVLLSIASDTDNTGEQARAVFADFHLVPRGQACAFPPAKP